ncbi:hypothetical protein EUTSA_v10009786mg [Eutrema salsugineum]|uniref:Leucine-rich repeat-containing N-terminal plant-type domain-containing protein n=1 Tax=Eutrema salsugineum TaxID=72664 RepID=V4L109_EUTSA|nr:hypothetical protein EUTSA_v10009786mg [Eutrema salsugineum]
MKTIPKWISSPEIYSLILVKCGINMSLDNWKQKRIKSLSYIDLSENEISGSPAWFDLGKLKSFSKTLKTLDLSRNLVFGRVSETVAGVKKINLRQNHLCGKLRVTKFQASVFTSNDCLCSSPLPPCKT